MITRIALLVFIVSAFISCNKSAGKVKGEDEIYKVVYATGGCFGDCPIEVFSVDTSFKMKYHGVGYAENKGFYTGKINKVLWDSISAKFDALNYKQLDTAYGRVTDEHSAELFLYYRHKIKHIWGQRECFPDSLSMVFHWLTNVLNKVSLTQTDDSMKFETIVEKPVPAIIKKRSPMPSIVDND